jgi:predicted transglutaminase-like cysteine proteinase
MLIVTASGVFSYAPASHARSFEDLMGYESVAQDNIEVFPQWVGVIGQPEAAEESAGCSDEGKSAQCHLKRWWDFLGSLRGKTPREQLAAVNTFVNEQKYVGDRKNYGQEDYWAAPEQLMSNGGDCEDYVIMKFLSLRKLGWSTEDMRLVVVQDTRQRTQHAVLAVKAEHDVLILDNQSRYIESQANVPHYAPVVSMSDSRWWLHTTDSQLVAANR